MFLTQSKGSVSASYFAILAYDNSDAPSSTFEEISSYPTGCFSSASFVGSPSFPTSTHCGTLGSGLGVSFFPPRPLPVVLSICMLMTLTCVSLAWTTHLKSSCPFKLSPWMSNGCLKSDVSDDTSQTECLTFLPQTRPFPPQLMATPTFQAMTIPWSHHNSVLSFTSHA